MAVLGSSNVNKKSTNFLGLPVFFFSLKSVYVVFRVTDKKKRLERSHVVRGSDGENGRSLPGYDNHGRNEIGAKRSDFGGINDFAGDLVCRINKD